MSDKDKDKDNDNDKVAEAAEAAEAKPKAAKPKPAPKPKPTPTPKVKAEEAAEAAEPDQVVSSLSMEEAFGQAAEQAAAGNEAAPIKGDTRPKGALAGGRHDRQVRPNEVAATNAEKAAREEAERARAEADAIEGKGQPTLTEEELAAEEERLAALQQAEDDRVAARREDRERRAATGERRQREPKPETHSDPEVRLANPFAKIAELAADGGRPALDKLRALISRYGELAQRRFRDLPAIAGEEPYEYQERNARHKAAHMRECADLNLLAARASSALAAAKDV